MLILFFEAGGGQFMSQQTPVEKPPDPGGKAGPLNLIDSSMQRSNDAALVLVLQLVK